MTRQPPEEIDSAIRAWMNEQGWPVTDTYYDFDRMIHAWRHDVAGECYTLRITQIVIEDAKSPLALVEALNFWKVADELRKQPDAYTLVKRSPTGVVVEQLPGPPWPMR